MMCWQIQSSCTQTIEIKGRLSGVVEKIDSEALIRRVRVGGDNNEKDVDPKKCFYL